MLRDGVNFQELKDSLGMKYTTYDAGYTTITYSQIESPKASMAVQQCRGVIFDKDLNIVCRAFDRFFNFGEMQVDLDFKNSKVLEKVDGSLIKFWHDRIANSWQTATSKSIYGEFNVVDHPLTYNQLVLKALNIETMEQFNNLCQGLDKDVTYIFEVTSPLNRVVTRYEETSLWYLGARNNKTGEYVYWECTIPNVKLPKTYDLGSISECVQFVEKFKNLEEGFVIYENNIPKMKLKSPLYVQAHLIRGEGLTVSKISNLICLGEVDEYLSYFPNDKDIILPFVKNLDKTLQGIDEYFNKVKDISNRAEFAKTVKEYEYCSFMFKMYGTDKNARDVFLTFNDSVKKKIILGNLSIL